MFFLKSFIVSKPHVSYGKFSLQLIDSPSYLITFVNPQLLFAADPKFLGHLIAWETSDSAEIFICRFVSVVLFLILSSVRICSPEYMHRFHCSFIHQLILLTSRICMDLLWYSLTFSSSSISQVSEDNRYSFSVESQAYFEGTCFKGSC